MQYQNLGILQKGKILQFRYKQQLSWLHSYANEEQPMGAIFTPCAFLWICGGGEDKIHFLYWEIVIICLDK